MNNTVLRMESFAKRLNDYTYTDYYYRLSLIARSVFKWKNLPNFINEKWIEKFLYYEGGCVFFKDNEKGLMVAKCKQSGNLNHYDEITKVIPYGVNYTGSELTVGKDCIYIPNNDLYLPTDPTIRLYAYRLADISRTIDINIAAQKTPLIVLCTDKQRLSLKNVMKQSTGNELIIYGDKNLDIDSIKSLKTDVPIVFPELQIQKHEIWNEIMTFLGVNNANMNKRERLVTDEVSANNEQIQISADVMLKSREEAVKRINEMFGTNIEVGLREDVVKEIEKAEKEVV